MWLAGAIIYQQAFIAFPLLGSYFPGWAPQLPASFSALPLGQFWDRPSYGFFFFFLQEIFWLWNGYEEKLTRKLSESEIEWKLFQKHVSLTFRLLPDFRLQVGGGTVIAWLQRESAEAKGDLWGHVFPSLFSLCVPGEWINHCSGVGCSCRAPPFGTCPDSSLSIEDCWSRALYTPSSPNPIEASPFARATGSRPIQPGPLCWRLSGYMWGTPRKDLSGPERLSWYCALPLMNGWAEERWAARGWGGGEGWGLWRQLLGRRWNRHSLLSFPLQISFSSSLSLLWALGPCVWPLWAPGGREATYHLGGYGRKHLYHLSCFQHLQNTPTFLLFPFRVRRENVGGGGGWQIQLLGSCGALDLELPHWDQLWTFTGRTDAEAEAPVFWSSNVNRRLIGKVPDTGKDWSRAEEEGFRGWDSWMALPMQWTWTWTNSGRH